MCELCSRDLVGHWVLDRRGRPLGEMVGIVHHGNGRTSLLVHSGSWRTGTGMMVPVESAVIAGVDVHLDRPQHHHHNRRFLERIGDAMWPSATVRGR